MKVIGQLPCIAWQAKVLRFALALAIGDVVFHVLCRHHRHRNHLQVRHQFRATLRLRGLSAGRDGHYHWQCTNAAGAHVTLLLTH